MTYSDVGLKNQYSLWWSSAQGNRKKNELGGTEQGFQWGSIPLREKKKSELSIAHPEIILVKPEK